MQGNKNLVMEKNKTNKLSQLQSKGYLRASLIGYTNKLS